MPWVTIALIVINLLVWLAGITPAATQVPGSTRAVSRHDLWTAEFGAVPCELLGRCANQAGTAVIDGGILDTAPRTVEIDVPQQPPALTLLTSLFVHGGIIHLGFNMLFLAIYGRVVEESMHPLGYLAFYLLAGVVAMLGQGLFAPSASGPVIGASGAIAAVIAAYLLLYPRARILTMIVPPLCLWIPAWFAAGAWGVLQLWATYENVLAPTALDSGVAYVAHVFGFVFGLSTVAWFADRRIAAYDEQHRSASRQA
ncbi:MAG: rhomboid family intrarane serine protease [Thermoleophilia bacterium]|nr:rhomboid family intrarane serine protease [Thermoleophilia bacterium]